jgi:hypothetical protein
MNNKHVLQMIGGVLMFISFFLTWVYDGAFSYIKPSELIAISNRFYLTILLYLLPVLGVINVYKGYMKKYSMLLNIICIADCLILLVTILQTIPDDWIVMSGFYMAGLSVLVSAASIFIMKKEIKSENISSKG